MAASSTALAGLLLTLSTYSAGKVGRISHRAAFAQELLLFMPLAQLLLQHCCRKGREGW
jgi:hypothetical protein